MPTPRTMPSPQVAARCQDTRPDDSHEPFCFELFRRAIEQACSLCWHYVYNQYYRLVRYWVSQRTSADPDAIDDLTQDAFIKFWAYYTVDKLRKAGGKLGKVLSYLKSCAWSAVAEAHRRAERRVDTRDWDTDVVDDQVATPPTEDEVLQEMEKEQVWAIIEERCKDERDRLVAEGSFQRQWKPREIAERFPDAFPAVCEVYRIKRNLLGRLRRDERLQEMCENGLTYRSMRWEEPWTSQCA